MFPSGKLSQEACPFGAQQNKMMLFETQIAVVDLTMIKHADRRKSSTLKHQQQEYAPYHQELHMQSGDHRCPMSLPTHVSVLFTRAI